MRGEDDLGGVTMYGVSLILLKELSLWEGGIDGDGDIDQDDVRAVTKDTARAIFKRHLGDRPRAGKCPVSHGVLLSFRRQCRCFARGEAAAAVLVRGQGHLGRNTLAAAAFYDQRELASPMLFEGEQLYCGFVVKKPKPAAFLRS